MQVMLKDIASISSGVTFRVGIELAPNGNTRVIQMKDLGNNARVCLDNTIRIQTKQLPSSHLALKGDIIFRSRGQTTTAALLDTECTNTIIAAPLFRIRINTPQIIPEYLLWFINQPHSQAYFTSHAKGTQVKMINKQGLSELSIIIPSLQKQKEIVQLYDLSQQEQQLVETIQLKRTHYIQKLLLQLASTASSTTNDKINTKESI